MTKPKPKPREREVSFTLQVRLREDTPSSLPDAALGREIKDSVLGVVEPERFDLDGWDIVWAEAIDLRVSVPPPDPGQEVFREWRRHGMKAKWIAKRVAGKRGGVLAEYREYAWTDKRATADAFRIGRFRVAFPGSRKRAEAYELWLTPRDWVVRKGEEP